MIDVKIDSIKFWPQEVLTPEIRVHEDRKSLFSRQVASNVFE